MQKRKSRPDKGSHVKKIIPATAGIALFAVTPCEMLEEPQLVSWSRTSLQEAGHQTRAAKPKRHAVRWTGHMNEITVGMSEMAVKAILGKPDDTDSTQKKDFEGATTTMDNWTYGKTWSPTTRGGRRRSRTASSTPRDGFSHGRRPHPSWSQAGVHRAGHRGLRVRLPDAGYRLSHLHHRGRQARVGPRHHGDSYFGDRAHRLPALGGLCAEPGSPTTSSTSWGRASSDASTRQRRRTRSMPA